MAGKVAINTASAAGVTVKPIEDWVTAEETAEMLGISRSGVLYLIFHVREFNIDNDVRTVGARKIVVIRKSAVTKKKRERAADERLKAEGKMPQRQRRQHVG